MPSSGAVPEADPHPVLVRTRVRVPLRFANGYTATGDVFTFRGLADGLEHLLIGLGGW